MAAGTVSRDISLSVTAEVERYAAQMGKIPGITQKEAAKAATALGKELAKAELQVLKNVKPSVDAAARSFGDMKQAVGALAPGVGRLAADFEDLLGFLGPAGAAVGVGAAVVAAGMAFVSLTRSAAESSEKLEKVGFMSAAAGQQLRDATVTLDAAGLAFEAMKGQVAGLVSGALQGLVRWTFIAAMAWDDFIHGRGVQGIADYVVRVEAVEASVAALGETVTKTGKAATESLLPAFDRLVSAQSALTSATQEWMVEIGDTTQIESLREIAREQETFALRRIELMRLEGATAAELADAETMLEAQRIRAAQSIGQAVAASEKTQQAARRASVNAALGGINTILGAMSGMVEQGSFAAKALASLQVVVSTAAAFMNALATPPFPLGVALAAMAATAGVISLANVWKAKPGAKSTGQMPSVSMSGAGGRGGSSRPTSSTSSSGGGNHPGGSYALQFRHRIYDDVTDDALRRSNSPLRQALGSTNPHRSR